MNSDSYILFVLLICCVLVSSCVDKIALPETSSLPRIHVECELSPPFHIQAKLSTTGDLGGRYFPEFHEDATIMLSSSSNEEFTFHYNKNLKVYEITDGKLNSNLTYTLSASVRDTSISSVYAGTGIPAHGQIEDLQVLNLESIRYNAGLNKDIITISVKLLNPSDQYFKVNFDSRYARIDHSKAPAQLLYAENLENAEIGEIMIGGNGVHFPYHLEGVLIDPSQLNDNIFIVKLEVDRSGMESDDFLKSVYIELMSVTESYYKYHLALSKQLKIKGRRPIEPVIDYSNINNGYGFIGAYVTSIDSVVVQQ